MIKALFTATLSICCLAAQAQLNNLYVSNGISTFREWPIIESGDQVYFLSDKRDKVGIGPVVVSYFFSSVNKYTHTLSKSVLLFQYTDFNIKPEDIIQVSYTLNPDTKKFNFFTVTSVDSSLYETSLIRQYPKKISFMQLDADLNITVANKPLLYSGRSGRYIISGMGFSENGPKNRTVLTYNVCDTSLSANFYQNWYANKLLMVDDTGRMVANEFLGPEPQGLLKLSVSVTEKIYKNYNSTYGAVVVDMVSFPQEYALLILDSNLHLVNTYAYPTSRYGFGGYDQFFFLPTGSFIRSAMGMYVDTVVHKFNGIGKGSPASAYIPDQLYFPPPSGTNDYYHSTAGDVISLPHSYDIYATVTNPTVYNSFDHRIYTFSSTKSDGYTYCVNGASNLGQIAAIDSNLNEKWVKYLHPQLRHCIKSASVASTDSRNGVLISGWEYDLSNTGVLSPFIYHIDSTTSLGVNNPESPVIISDQFTLYPNPATEQLFIENVLGTRYSWSIINSIGQAVVSGTGQGGKTSVPVKNLPPGLYLAHIQAAGSKTFSLRFVKE